MSNASPDIPPAVLQACASVTTVGPLGPIQGTAYRISSRFAVTSEVVVRGLRPQDRVELVFPGGTQSATLLKTDVEADCALLALSESGPEGEVPHLSLSPTCSRGAAWEAIGYAEAGKTPVRVAQGSIQEVDGEDRQRGPALVLRTEAPLLLPALGCPVLSGGQVVGHLKGRPAGDSGAGPLYACPVRNIEALLPAESRRVTPQPPHAAYDPAWYISRDEEEQKALNYLEYPGQPVIIWGPELFGKTWLLRHLIQRVQKQDPHAQVVVVNLGVFDKSSWQQPQGVDVFLREMALHVAHAIGASADDVYREWSTPSATANLDRVMRRLILPRVIKNGSRLFLAVESADAVFGSPLQNTFFGILRGWAESDEPWSCLRLLLSISTTPALLVSSQHQSPFNLTDAVELKDLNDEQLLRLCSLYQLRWDKAELKSLKRWVGGHPYLARLAMYTAVRQNVSLNQLLDVNHPAGTVFDSFLSRVSGRLRRHPERVKALRQMLQDPAADLGEAELPLMRAGLVVRNGQGGHVPRYEIYRRLIEANPGTKPNSADAAAFAETAHQPLPGNQQADVAQVEVGRRLGPYEVVRKLGAGGMGMVYEVMNEQLKRRGALKVLHAQLSRDQELVKRFQTEAKAANVVQHPSMINIYEMGHLAGGETYFIMEYLDGESLGDRLEKRGKLPVDVTVRLCQQIAAGLSAAHQKGVVHRDLKPNNVMAVLDSLVPGGERVKILDFGLAKVEKRAFDDSLTTDRGMLMGTPVYMAPEQCRGAAEVDGKVDVYALGIMLYEFLVGRPPFLALDHGEILAMHMRDPVPQLQKIDPGLPKDLCTLIHKMLSKEAEQRPTMAEVSGELQRLQGELSGALAQSNTQQVVSTALASRGLILSLIVLLLLAASGFLFWMRR